MKKHLALLCLALVTACARPGGPASSASTDAAGPDASAPSLAVSVSPSSLMQGAQATVHVRAENPGNDDLETCDLILGYATENDPSVIMITDLPLSLPAGGIFEQDVPWTIDFQPDADASYQVQLMLLTSDGTSLAEISVPVEIVQPVVTISVNPVELSQGSQAAVSVQVTNPSGADMEGITLMVGYGAEGGTSIYPIQEIPLSIPAGETFSQDIPWTVDYVPSGGSYEVSATLLLPGMVVWLSAAASVTLAAP